MILDRYVVFGWHGTPSGGWKDVHGTFVMLEEAASFACAWGWDHWQIVDLTTAEIVAEYP